MSFSFRNLFAQDDNGNSASGDRTDNSSASGIPGVHEYEVSELLPFIPPAIVAQNGIPMDKSIHIILPADGSNDVRLSTIYQSCPSLFAAEITPLNDSIINLPPKPAQTTPQPPLSGNPFGNDLELQTENRTTDIMTEERPAPPTLPETNPEAQNPSPDFGFSSPLEESSQTNGNPFTGTPEEAGTLSEAESSEATNSEFAESAPASPNPFVDLPNAAAAANSPFETVTGSESSPENPFGEESQAATDFFTAPVNSAESGGEVFGNAMPTEAPAEDQNDASGEVAFGTDSDSFATLFSQKAQEDKGLSVPGTSAGDDAPSDGAMLDEHLGEYVGPSIEPGVSPFAGMDGDEDENLGFESFIPPEMQEDSVAEPVSEDVEFGPMPVSAEEFVAAIEIPNPGNEVKLPGSESENTLPEKRQEQPADPKNQEDQQAEQAEQAEDSPPEEKPTKTEAVQDKPIENPPVESEAREEVPENAENDEVGEDQNKESSTDQEPAARETEEADHGVLATALVESGVMMTPSGGYSIPDPVPSETPRDDDEPVKVQQAEVPAKASFSAPEQRPTEVSASPPPPSDRLAQPASPSSHPYASTGPSLRDIELRAVFATEESFTLTRVTQKVTEMEGVLACAIVMKHDMIEHFEDQADAIGHKTRDLAEHVRCLASVTGVDGASYFTLHMDRVIMSFFFGENHILGVNHAPDAFKPGTREKLVLITRSLEGLEK